MHNLDGKILYLKEKTYLEQQILKNSIWLYQLSWKCKLATVTSYNKYKIQMYKNSAQLHKS